jgi:hypothetical protein
MLAERTKSMDGVLEPEMDPCFPYPKGRTRRALTIFLGKKYNFKFKLKMQVP